MVFFLPQKHNSAGMFLSFKEQFSERVVTKKGYHDKNLQQIRSYSRAMEFVFQACSVIASML